MSARCEAHYTQDPCWKSTFLFPSTRRQIFINNFFHLLFIIINRFYMKIFTDKISEKHSPRGGSRICNAAWIPKWMRNQQTTTIQLANVKLSNVESQIIYLLDIKLLNIESKHWITNHWKLPNVKSYRMSKIYRINTILINPPIKIPLPLVLLKLFLQCHVQRFDIIIS
jgi:hypothetical protein